MGMGGGGSSTTNIPANTTQTNITEPWSAQQPYLKTGFAQAQNLLGNPPAVFPNPMTLPLSPETQTANQLITMRALNGSPLNQSASNMLQGAINGDYLNNPTVNGNYLYGGDGFNAALKAASDAILPQIDSQFESSGRFNSGLAKTAQTQALANAFASQYGNERQLQEQNYNNQRQQQMQAAVLAPNIANQDYADYAALQSVGQQNQDQLQNQLNEQQYRFSYPYNTAQQTLSQFMQNVMGNFGQSSTTNSSSSGGGTTTTNSGNPLMGALGGALTGSSLFGATGLLGGLGLGSGMGALLGGGLGLLGGFL